MGGLSLFIPFIILEVPCKLPYNLFRIQHAIPVSNQR